MTMKKRIVTLLLLALPILAAAQDESRYLRGAVPVENGYVVFRQHFNCTGKTQEEIRLALVEYLKENVVKGPNALPQARFTDLGDSTGYIAASVEETLYFRRAALVTHSTRFYYQLVCTPQDGGFDIEMRRLHYLYEEAANAGQRVQDFPAEEWITDEEALNKKGKLTRLAGKKFRRFTIDRKDEIFQGAARAAGADRRTRVVEEYEY